MRSPFTQILAAVIIVGLFIGCSDFPGAPVPNRSQEDTELQELLSRPFIMTDNMPPSPLETVVFGSESLTFWPFTGNDFSGQGVDPVNLIFVGKADPRDIRAALLSLDGNRPGTPPIPPFNSIWDDAIGGDVQTSYGEPDGWTGGVIQLACGDFAPLRVHLRLFKMGDWTVGGAHFEMNIPGTADHQVLSWELAEQFVIGDLMRSGLLDGDVPMIPTQQINPSPWRTIPAIIYNSLPELLKEAIGGPPGEVVTDVPIFSDGYAIILNLAGTVPRVAETRTQSYLATYGQVVPKPFCQSSPDDYVYVEGPVQMVMTTSLTDEGVYHSTFRAEGTLAVTSVSPVPGETLTAEVFQHQDAHFSDATQWATSMMSQHLLPDNAEGAGRLFIHLQVRSDGHSGYRADIRCADGSWQLVDEWDLPPAMQEPTVAPGSTLDVRF